MFRFKKVIIVSMVIVAASLSIASVPSDLDPRYIEKFGYGSICVSDKGYPVIDKFDESQFDYRNGVFFIEPNKQLNVRAILPEGKKYIDYLNDFISRTPGYTEDDALEKIVWRVFASHDLKGNKIYGSFPPSNSEMLKSLSYKTSDKELAFVTVDMSLRQPEVREWTTSGIPYSNSELVPLVGQWLSSAKKGWQLYIVHTVGCLISNNYVVDDPIVTVLVEVK